MSSQRILQVIIRSGCGSVLRIVESPATRIYEIAAVACGPGGRLIDRIKNEDIAIHAQPHLQSFSHPKDALGYRDLRRLITRGEFDIAHNHSTKDGALARIAASRAGIAVFYAHSWLYYNSALHVVALTCEDRKAAQDVLSRRIDETTRTGSKNDESGERGIHPVCPSSGGYGVCG